jgi:hypothetical protein
MSRDDSESNFDGDLDVVAESSRRSSLGTLREEVASSDILAEKPLWESSVESLQSDLIDSPGRSLTDIELETQPETAPEPLPMPAISEDKQLVSFLVPPGKLGIIIDRAAGQPEVCKVLKTSPIIEHIAIGDILCEVDGVNTRTMSNASIAALLSASAGKNRIFKVERDG